MKKSIVLVLSFLFCIMAFGQEIHYEDVVYLKNGSIIRGMIIEQIPDETIKIKTADRNLFVFKYEEIQKITKEEVTGGKKAASQSPPPPESTYTGKEKGFEGTVDLLFAINLEWGEPVLGMDAVFGYRLIPQVFLGAGAGIEVYSEETMAPVFFQIRTDFIKSKVTPFFYANVGYAFGWISGEDGSDWGGLLMEPGVGFRFNIAEHFGLNISSSFKFQRAYYSYHYYGPYPQNNEYYSREQETLRLFTFKVGFSF